MENRKLIDGGSIATDANADSPWWCVGIAAVLAAAAQWLPGEAAPPAWHVANIWLSGPIVLCLLLLSPRARWMSIVAGAMLGSAGICVSRGNALLPACVILFGELACVLAAARLLFSLRGGRIDAAVNAWDLLRFFVIAAVLPAIGAAWHTAASQQLRPDVAVLPWRDLASARMLAYLLVVPPVFAVARWAASLREVRASLASANDRLGALARATLQVQEAERSRIARDLHDDISQSLAAVSIELSALRRALQGREQVQAEEIQEALLAVVEDVRRLSHDLHPGMLRYTSLAASLASLCESHTFAGGLRVECGPLQEIGLSETQKLNLYRVAQEGIHNVERHACARTVRVSLTAAGDDLLLRVDDDGIGLAPGFTDGASPGLGLVSIGERMRLLGGRFSLAGRESGGTRLEARCPLRRPGPWT